MPRKTSKPSAEKTVRNIRRATRRRYSAEEKLRIVLEGLRGEDSIAELCSREGLNANVSQTPIPAQFPTNSRLATPQKLSNLRLVIFGFLQDIYLVSFLMGKLRIASHVCSSCLAVRKATMLTQLALLPSRRVALTN